MEVPRTFWEPSLIFRQEAFLVPRFLYFSSSVGPCFVLLNFFPNECPSLCCQNIWQILKRFAGSFLQAWISYFWRLYYDNSHLLNSEFSGNTRSQPKNGLEGIEQTKLFFISLPNFVPYLMIFFSKCIAAKLWKIVKYGKNLAKNEEKPCSTCLEPIFWLIPSTRKSNFRYSFGH